MTSQWQIAKQMFSIETDRGIFFADLHIDRSSGAWIIANLSARPAPSRHAPLDPDAICREGTLYFSLGLMAFLRTWGKLPEDAALKLRPILVTSDALSARYAA